MDGSQSETTIHLQLESSNKRPISRVSSSSPSQTQASKRVCRQQDNQPVDALMIHQPTPVSATFPSVAFLENQTASQEAQSLEFVDNWLEDIYPTDFDCQLQSRSASFFRPVVEEPSCARAIQSAPPIMASNMPPPQGRRGSGQAPTPGSSGPSGMSRGQSRPSVVSPGMESGVTSSGRTSGPLVTDSQYEAINLAANNIFHRDRREPFPDHISGLVQMAQRPRNSPTPSFTEFNADDALADLERGAGEPAVEQYFQSKLIPQPLRGDPLKRSDKLPMSKTAVPNTGTSYRLSNPAPDVLVGYNISGAFSPPQRMQLATMNLSSANNDGLCLPFFILEFKGDGPSSNGSL
ncbi:hypothetical protein FSARC_5377 [Fusarium sarcochroum]|uniref:Uncharacterized protein n=1 Tax=Fusarium sarcochroum TaxID=1208366 RepID=A0A8H4TZI2_9HYPO|nr:hypothetical protein FSARC_5377 [Fusarium sarcochroum]